MLPATTRHRREAVIDPQTRAAIEAVPLPALLPPRTQARADDLDGRVDILDALEVGASANGEVAWIVIAHISSKLQQRDVIVPGVMRDGVFVRDPGIARFLRSGNFGDFTVDIRHGGVPVGSVRELDVDQSNDSVVIDESVVVKWQLDAVASPAPQRLLSLAGTDITPSVRAIVWWRDAERVERTVLTATDYLEGAEDGWTWAVDLVRAHAQGEVVDAIEPFARLGEMTARMHLAFASNGVQHLDRADIVAMHAECRTDLEEAVGLIDGAEGERLRSRADAIASRLDRLLEIDTTAIIDIHGDFHIGQVVRSTHGGQPRYAFVDFDGNPVMSPEQRLRKQPAARDVAGMLASIDHVARVVNYRTEGLDPRPATIWIPHAQDAFLAAYQSTLSMAGRSDLLDLRFLAPLMLDQECREFVYSARHLPHWRYVPDAVLSEMFPDQGAQ